MREWMIEWGPEIAGYLIIGALLAWAWVTFDGDYWVFEGEDTKTEIGMFVVWPLMLTIVVIIMAMRGVVKLYETYIEDTEWAWPLGITIVIFVVLLIGTLSMAA